MDWSADPPQSALTPHRSWHWNEELVAQRRQLGFVGDHQDARSSGIQLSSSEVEDIEVGPGEAQSGGNRCAPAQSNGPVQLFSALRRGMPSGRLVYGRAP